MTKRNLTEDEIDYILDFITPQLGIPFDSAMSIVENNKLRLKKQLLTQLVYPEIIPKLKESIRTSYINTTIQPGESVGILTAQSIGEKQTQLTLNSVVYHTEIVINSKRSIDIHKIGEFIDNMLLQNKKDIENIETNNTQFLNIQKYKLSIPSCNEHGQTCWDDIIGVSKHLPNGNLVKIKTQLGREVIATQSKSFIVWNKELCKFEPTFGSDIKIGDILPTTSRLRRSAITLTLDLEQYFPKTIYIHTNEIIKAIRQTRTRSKEKFKINFTIPYNSVLDMDTSFFKDIQSGFIMDCDNYNDKIPVNISLDNDFGFFIGIYLSEEKIYKGVIHIKNKDIHIKNRINTFLETIGSNMNMLSILLKTTCIVGVHKIVPKFAFNAPDCFIEGIIEGYYSVNCKIDKRDYSINICSKSSFLIHDISFLLSYYEIVGKISIHKKANTTTLTIRNYYTQVFSCCFTLLNTKNKKIQKCYNKCFMFSHGKYMEDFPKNRDVYFDRVISIECVEMSLHPYVYDFETDTTKNFSLYNGLVCRDSFHKAGLADKMVVSGVSKFSELVNATKNPKDTSCVVYFKNNNNSIQQLRDNIGSSIIEHTLKSMSSSMEVFISKEPEKWYNSYKILYDNKYEKYTDCVSIKLKLNILFELKLNMDEIVSFIENEYSDMACVFSPSGQLDIYVDTSNINLPEDRKIFIDENIINVIYLEEVVVPNLENLKICGISGIKNIFYIKNETDDSWSIETDGSNFTQLMAHPKIDMTRVISNNVWDIYNTLGIEAARDFLITEFSNIMEGVTACHIKLLVERMTFSGNITSISRYTMRADESGPLGKCSFEESIDGFCKAGVYGEEEPTRGVSSCIIVGKRSNIGTGCMDLRIDISKLPKAKTILTEVNEK